MQTKLYRNKIIVTDISNPERLQLRRTALNFTTKDGDIILEDNIFNRVLLSLDYSEILRDISHFDTEINKKALPYQKCDISHILDLKFSFNINKPGYGKTFESIEYCRLKGLKRILVICPKSVVNQWAEQFRLWWPEVDQILEVGGAGPENREKIIYITNYEQMLRPQVWQRCKMFLWDVIIVDESHRIKSAKSKTTMLIKQLPALRKMCLSGTPILNRPDDLWSQLNFLSPKISGNSYWAFVDKFCEVEENNFGRKPIGLTPSGSAQELLTKVLNIISVGGENHKVTGGKNFIPIELEMNTAQRKLYKDIVNLSLDNLEQEGVTVKNAMDQIIKQQQCTTNPDGLLENKKIGNPKFEWLVDWLEDNENEKIVVYSKFAKTVKALHNYLRNKGIKSVYYIGEMSSQERSSAKNLFVQPSGDTRVLIGTIGALGTGVDGLQHVCRNVIFLDRDWTPGLNEQAEDRVNRSGQIGMTNIWILNMKNSIDEYVEQLQGKKAEDIMEVFKNVSVSFRSGK